MNKYIFLAKVEESKYIKDFDIVVYASNYKEAFKNAEEVGKDCAYPFNPTKSLRGIEEINVVAPSK